HLGAGQEVAADAAGPAAAGGVEPRGLVVEGTLEEGIEADGPVPGDRLRQRGGEPRVDGPAGDPRRVRVAGRRHGRGRPQPRPRVSRSGAPVKWVSAWGTTPITTVRTTVMAMAAVSETGTRMG